MRRTLALPRFNCTVACDGHMEFGWCPGGVACQMKAAFPALLSLESLTRRAVQVLSLQEFKSCPKCPGERSMQLFYVRQGTYIPSQGRFKQVQTQWRLQYSIRSTVVFIQCITPKSINSKPILRGISPSRSRHRVQGIAPSCRREAL
jgi:hypothetical protein